MSEGGAKIMKADLDMKTRLVFSTLKPYCLRVMQALQLASDDRTRRNETNALREPLQSLERLLISSNESNLPKDGFPRCIDYVLIPLIMALPMAVSPPERESIIRSGDDRIFRAITALVIASGVDEFINEEVEDTLTTQSSSSVASSQSNGSRLDNVILRVTVCLADFNTARKNQLINRSTSSTSSLSRVGNGSKGGIGGIGGEKGSGGNGIIGGNSIIDEEPATSALNLLSLILSHIGGLGKKPSLMEIAIRKYLQNDDESSLSSSSFDYASYFSFSHNKSATSSPSMRIRPSLFPAILLTKEGFVGHLFSVILEIISSSHNARSTRLSALRCLASVLVFIGRSSTNKEEKVTAGKKVDNGSSNVQSTSSPSPSRVTPFLPGIATTLVKLIAPPPSTQTQGTDEVVDHTTKAAPLPLIAAASHCLRLVFEVCLSDDVYTSIPPQVRDDKWWSVTMNRMAQVLKIISVSILRDGSGVTQGQGFKSSSIQQVSRTEQSIRALIKVAATRTRLTSPPGLICCAQDATVYMTGGSVNNRNWIKMNAVAFIASNAILVASLSRLSFLLLASSIRKDLIKSVGSKRSSSTSVSSSPSPSATRGAITTKSQENKTSSSSSSTITSPSSSSLLSLSPTSSLLDTSKNAAIMLMDSQVMMKRKRLLSEKQADNDPDFLNKVFETLPLAISVTEALESSPSKLVHFIANKVTASASAYSANNTDEEVEDKDDNDISNVLKGSSIKEEEDSRATVRSLFYIAMRLFNSIQHASAASTTTTTTTPSSLDLNNKSQNSDANVNGDVPEEDKDNDKKIVSWLKHELVQSLALVPTRYLHLIPRSFDINTTVNNDLNIIDEIIDGVNDNDNTLLSFVPPPFLIAADIDGLVSHTNSSDDDFYSTSIPPRLTSAPFIHDNSSSSSSSSITAATIHSTTRIRPQDNTVLKSIVLLIQSITSNECFGPTKTLLFIKSLCVTTDDNDDTGSFNDVQILWLLSISLTSASKHFSNSIAAYFKCREQELNESKQPSSTSSMSSDAYINLGGNNRHVNAKNPLHPHLLSTAKEWGVCVAEGSKVAIGYAIKILRDSTTLTLNTTSHLLLTDIQRIQCCSTIATVAKVCGNAFGCFVKDVLPVLLSSTLSTTNSYTTTSSSSSSSYSTFVSQTIAQIASSSSTIAIEQIEKNSSDSTNVSGTLRIRVLKARDRLLPLPRRIEISIPTASTTSTLSSSGGPPISSSSLTVSSPSYSLSSRTTLTLLDTRLVGTSTLVNSLALLPEASLLNVSNLIARQASSLSTSVIEAMKTLADHLRFSSFSLSSTISPTSSSSSSSSSLSNYNMSKQFVLTAPSVASLLVANLASFCNSSSNNSLTLSSALSPHHQLFQAVARDVATTTRDALLSLSSIDLVNSCSSFSSSSTSTRLDYTTLNEQERGELRVSLLHTLFVITSSIASVSVNNHVDENENIPPIHSTFVPVLSDNDDTITPSSTPLGEREAESSTFNSSTKSLFSPTVSLTERSNKSKLNSSLIAVGKLPYLSDKQIDIVTRILLVACEALASATILTRHQSGPSSSYSSSIHSTTTNQIHTSSSPLRSTSLRSTLVAISCVCAGVKALARHPEVLFPILHRLWPHLLELLPQHRVAATSATSLISSSSSLSSSSSSTSTSILVRQAVKTQPVFATNNTRHSILSDATRDFMKLRKTFLEKSRRESSHSKASSSSTHISKGKEEAPVREVQRLSLPGSSSSSSPEKLKNNRSGHNSQLIVELSSTSTSGPASEGGDGRGGGTSDAHLYSSFTSTLTYFTQAAAFDVIRVITSEAYAADFLRSRFSSDIWPRMVPILIHAYTLKREGKLPPLTSGRQSSSSSRVDTINENHTQHAHPLLRLILSVLSLIESSASPAATIRMHRTTMNDDGGEGGGEGGGKMPYGSDIPGVSDIRNFKSQNADGRRGGSQRKVLRHRPREGGEQEEAEEIEGAEEVEEAATSRVTRVGIEPSVFTANGIAYECSTILCLLIKAGKNTPNTINSNSSNKNKNDEKNSSILSSAILIEKAAKRSLLSLQVTDAHCVWQAKATVFGVV